VCGVDSQKHQLARIDLVFYQKIISNDRTVHPEVYVLPPVNPSNMVFQIFTGIYDCTANITEQNGRGWNDRLDTGLNVSLE
jgi:hypothetical protein